MKYIFLFSWLLPLHTLAQAGKEASLKNADTANKSSSIAFRPFGTATDTFVYFQIADTSYSVYTLPAKLNKPLTWKKRDMSRMGPLGNSYLVTYTDTLTLEKVMRIIDHEKDFYQVCAAKSWCNNHYKEAFPYLVTRLTNKQKIGLSNSADLIIPQRMGTGDLEFYGHGGTMEYDLFTAAGRVSWILNDLTGEKFAIVRADLSKAEALAYKTLWKEYVEKIRSGT